VSIAHQPAMQPAPATTRLRPVVFPVLPHWRPLTLAKIVGLMAITAAATALACAIVFATGFVLLSSFAG
jgi:hypothetical protein